MLSGPAGPGEGVLCLAFPGGLLARGGLSQRDGLEAGPVGCGLRTASGLLPGAGGERGLPVVSERRGGY